jgi:hypothetical protein
LLTITDGVADDFMPRRSKSFALKLKHDVLATAQFVIVVEQCDLHENCYVGE